jgi:hypothetical protein
MDSTFMGVLAGLAFRLRKTEEAGEVVLLNLSARNRGLLATLGLDQTVRACLEGSAPEAYERLLAESRDMASLEQEEESRRDTAATMLEAHENLVRVTPENYPKFKDVLTFLREDLHQQEDDQS